MAGFFQFGSERTAAAMNFLARYWPYIALLIGLAVLWGLHLHDQRRYGALETDYANYRIQVADANSRAQQAARQALEAQIIERSRIDKRNAEVLADYVQTNAVIAADRDRSRDLARRLLAAAAKARAATPSDHLPEAANRPETLRTREAGSATEIVELLTDTSAECRGNAAQLNALIAELRPQL